jgi:hypothetical protein
LSDLINAVAGGDAELLANMINKSLLNVYKDLTPLSPEPALHKCVSALPTFVIQPYEVFQQLSKISVHKSAGPDNVPNWYLRDFAFALSEPICHIFNCSLQLGKVPYLWKAANVVPIPKSGAPKSTENDLRPISLTPTLSKVLESFVGRWVLPALSSHFDCRQFGAIKGRSTTHALIDIVNTWHQALDNSQSTRTLFVDYSKAFDHVGHATVLEKMSALGVDPELTTWLRSFLSNRQQRVKVGGCFSKWVTLRGGMPQGSWFGPLVFIVLINNLTSTMPLFKFVDDVTMVESIEKAGSSGIQAAADQLADWSRQNFMNINFRKTKEMCMGAIRESLPPPIIIDGNCIDRVDFFKLLGIIITSNLKWEAHVSAIHAKACKRLHILKLLKRSSLSSQDLLQYYKTVIRSVIEYACPVWQSSLTKEQRNRLESIQRRAICIISGSSDYELYCTIYGIEPLGVRLDELTKSMFNRICRSNDCLHVILPSRRSPEVLSRLRNYHRFSNVLCRTERYARSFLPYCLTNYQ